MSNVHDHKNVENVIRYFLLFLPPKGRKKCLLKGAFWWCPRCLKAPTTRGDPLANEPGLTHMQNSGHGQRSHWVGPDHTIRALGANNLVMRYNQEAPRGLSGPPK